MPYSQPLLKYLFQTYHWDETEFKQLNEGTITPLIHIESGFIKNVIIFEKVRYNVPINISIIFELVTDLSDTSCLTIWRRRGLKSDLDYWITLALRERCILGYKIELEKYSRVAYMIHVAIVAQQICVKFRTTLLQNHMYFIGYTYMITYNIVYIYIHEIVALWISCYGS